MSSRLLTSGLMTDGERMCYLAAERFYSAVGMCASSGRDPFWVDELVISKRLWLEKCALLIEESKPKPIGVPAS